MPDDSAEERYARILNDEPFPDEDLDDIYFAHTQGMDPTFRQLADGLFPLIKNLNSRIKKLEAQVEELTKK